MNFNLQISNARRRRQGTAFSARRACPAKVCGAALLACAGLLSAAAAPWPPLEEVVAVIRTHLADVPDEKLRAAAVEGLLAALAPDVLPVRPDPGAPAPALTHTNLFPGGFALLRVGRVGPGLPDALDAALTDLAGAGGLRGLVLDARFAGGEDFAAAAAAAARLAGTNPVAVTLGEETFAAPAGTNPPLPLMILVNRGTAGAAEALAAAARHAAPQSLVLGVRTAGEARRYRTVTLGTGAALRIAAEPAAIAGGPALGAAGVAPDLPVPVAPADEAAWLTNAFAAVRDGAAVAASPLRRFNEADLVRQRQGLPPLPFLTNAPRDQPADARLIVRDPALARALDLLAGVTAE